MIDRGVAVPTQVTEFRVQDIRLDDLMVSPSNVRKREITADIDDLAFSMATYGLQQPIVVQPRGTRYEILIGQRRFLAAKKLRWETLPAKVLPEPLSELGAKIVSFSENAQRRDLAPRDKAEVCEYLYRELGSVRAVAQRLGISEPTVRKWLGYAGVPAPLKDLVEQGRITRPVATRIAEHVPDEAQALAIATRLANEGPPAEQRERILDAVEEDPERPVEVIFQKAQEAREQTLIVFALPPSWTNAMRLAEREYTRSAGDIARDATIEWLTRFMELAVTRRRDT